MALPEFQRGYVWNRDQVRGLFDSLYKRHPVGALLVWATESQTATHRDHSGCHPDRMAVGSFLGPLISAMSSSLHQIEEQARLLSAEDRAKLAECMLESLHASVEEIEAAWSEEIAARIEAFAKGDIPAVSAEQIFAEARQILQ